ncbi:MAG: MDR family MFS transporter [Gaiellaceae bacterium]
MESGLRADLRALPRPAWLLFAGTFVNRFGTFVLVFLVLYLTRKGYSAGEASLALSAYGIGAIVASVLGGTLADRLGGRNTIAGSMFSSAAFLLALSQARGLATIVVLTALVGLTSELYRPASSALLADLTAPGARVTAYAVYRFAINLGFAAGPATAGFLADRSFFLVFLGDALSSIAFGVLALVALPEGTRTPRAREPRGHLLRALRSDRRFLAFLLASLLGSIVYFQQQATFPLQVRDAGHPAAIYGLLISLNGLVIVLFELPLTALTGRRPPRRVMALGSILVGLGFGVLGLSHALAALAVAVLVFTIGEMVWSPVANAYVADAAPEGLRGRYSGAWGLSFGIGLVIAPPLGTAVYGASPMALWLGCAGVGAVAALLVLKTG